MIAAGLQLMVLGMTIVFLFLIILVFLMNVMSTLVRKIEARIPQPIASGTTAVSPAGSAPTGSAPAPGSFDTHIPAVLAAVAAHRSRIGRAPTSDESAPNTTHSKGAST
jgi:oxaloacetate decarboxylase gamma subunit